MRAGGGRILNTYLRGVPINIIQRFWLIDPLTGDEVLTNPSTVDFIVSDPDGAQTTYTWGVGGEVTNPSVGVFVCALSPQLPVGIYHYRAEGTGAVVAAAEDDFEIIESSVLPPSPPRVPLLGPCFGWISGQDVANCAAVDYGQNPSVFDTVAYEASQSLYEISGRQFPGTCQRKVRPCAQKCSCWMNGPYSYGMGPWFWTTVPFGFGGAWAWYNETGDTFGCKPMSRWNLAGYPITKIVQVLIDGNELPEYDENGNRNWRLDSWRYLTRMDCPGNPSQPRLLPGCQNLSLDDDQPGTFSVEYQWGAQPPAIASGAAVEVAVQLWLACGANASDNCVLPTGVTQVNRSGITIERQLLANWLDPKKQTGLVQTDIFLASYAQGTRGSRRSAIFSPDLQPMARPLGTDYASYGD